MARKIYGVVDNNNVLHDISETETGAKRYATNNGYTKIGYRNADSYHAFITHVKDNGRWRVYRAAHKIDMV